MPRVKIFPTLFQLVPPLVVSSSGWPVRPHTPLRALVNASVPAVIPPSPTTAAFREASRCHVSPPSSVRHTTARPTVQGS